MTKLSSLVAGIVLGLVAPLVVSVAAARMSSAAHAAPASVIASSAR